MEVALGWEEVGRAMSGFLYVDVKPRLGGGVPSPAPGHLEPPLFDSVLNIQRPGMHYLFGCPFGIISTVPHQQPRGPTPNNDAFHGPYMAPVGGRPPAL